MNRYLADIDWLLNGRNPSKEDGLDGSNHGKSVEQFVDSLTTFQIEVAKMLENMKPDLVRKLRRHDHQDQRMMLRIGIASERKQDKVLGVEFRCISISSPHN
jgi:hypothetical protein